MNSGTSALATLLRRRALPVNCALTLCQSRELLDIVASSEGVRDVVDAVVVVTSEGAE